MWNWLRRPKRNSSSTSRRRFRPSFEPLEPRLPLAGNVTAVVSGGNLIVTGGNQGADIVISQPRAGKFTLEGIDTTINGSTSPVTFSKVTKDVRITFGNGNDILTFVQNDPIIIPGNLSINGGKGANKVDAPFAFGTLSVGGNLSVVNQSGAAQETALLNLNVKGNVKIENQGTLPRVAFGYSLDENDRPRTNTIRGNLSIANGPSQWSQVDLESFDIKGNVQIVNKGGPASVSLFPSSSTEGDGTNVIRGNLQITNGAGFINQTGVDATVKGNVQIRNQGTNASTNFGGRVDGNLQVTNVAAESGHTTVFGTIVGNLQVTSSASESEIIFVSATVKGTTNLQTGSGDDKIFVDAANFARAVQLQTGKGADMLNVGNVAEIEYSVFAPVLTDDGIEFVQEQRTRSVGSGPSSFEREVTANFGEGADTLILARAFEVRFKKNKAVLDGQGGSNAAQVENANLPVKPTFKRFQFLTLLFDDDSSPVGDGHASALAGFVDPAGQIHLAVSGWPDFDFDGSHTTAGDYRLYVRLGVADFSSFNPAIFNFQFTDSVVPGEADFFDLAGQTPGVRFIAWIDNTIGSAFPDTLLRFRALV